MLQRLSAKFRSMACPCTPPTGPSRGSSVLAQCARCAPTGYGIGLTFLGSCLFGRKLEPLQKLELYIKISELFLNYKNSLEAGAYINKAHQVCRASSSAALIMTIKMRLHSKDFKVPLTEIEWEWL